MGRVDASVLDASRAGIRDAEVISWNWERRTVAGAAWHSIGEWSVSCLRKCKDTMMAGDGIDPLKPLMLALIVSLAALAAVIGLWATLRLW